MRFPHDASDALLAHLADHGVLAGTVGPGIVRLVTHLDVTARDIDTAVAAFKDYFKRNAVRGAA